MFIVVIATSEGEKEYSHTQRKIAERQFEQYKTKPEVKWISIVRSVKRECEVIAHHEANLTSND